MNGADRRQQVLKALAGPRPCNLCKRSVPYPELDGAIVGIDGMKHTIRGGWARSKPFEVFVEDACAVKRFHCPYCSRPLEHGEPTVLELNPSSIPVYDSLWAHFECIRKVYEGKRGVYVYHG